MSTVSKVKRTSVDETSGTARTNRQRRAFVPVHPTPCGKYVLVAKLGHGGMAEVFLAVASGMGGFRKIAVVKRIHPQLLEEPEFVQMFMDEARLAARLSHPNVVQTHEVGEHENVPFIAMEYMEGQPYDKLLKAVRRKGGEIPIKLACRVAMDALAGLHYAHELKDYDGTSLGVVHRDISPSNIFITHQGVVKILDFGIAKATTKLSETRTGQIKGKLSYMAPEQARGKAIDRRADIWSIGVTLFETCADTRLFKGESDVDTLQRVLTGDIHSIMQEDGAKLPPPLLEVIEKSLARKVTDRYENATAMRKAIEAILPQLPGPDPDIAEFMQEHFEDVAEAARSMLGDLLENADRLAVMNTQELDAIGSSARRTASDPPPAVTVSEPSPAAAAPAPSSRARTAVMLLLVAAGIGGGAFVALSGLGDETPPPETPTVAGPATDPAGVVAPPTVPPVAAEVAPPTGEDPAGEDEIDEPEAPPDEGASARPRPRPTGRRAPRGESPSRPTPESQPETPRPTAASGSGTLRLVTTPYSEVYLDGRRLGVTPLLNQSLPVGSHTLTLRNPELGIEQRLNVQIRANEMTRLNIGLQ